jgi:peroxiredoxin
VSIDGQSLHKKFRESLDLPFPLLADDDGALSTQYDSIKEVAGKTFSTRKLVLIDREGLVVYRDDEYRLQDDTDFKALVDAVNKL